VDLEFEGFCDSSAARFMGAVMIFKKGEPRRMSSMTNPDAANGTYCFHSGSPEDAAAAAAVTTASTFSSERRMEESMSFGVSDS